jgi:methyl-accepting chemotaxis protein
MFAENLKIGGRLGGGFGVVLTLMVALTVIGTGYLRNIAGHLNAVVHEDNVMIDLSEKMRTLILYKAVTVRNVALLADVAAMQKEAERMADYDIQYHEAEDKLSKLANSETEKAMLADIQAQEKATAPAIKSAVDFGLGFQSELANKALLNDVRPAQEKWLVALEKLAAYEKNLAAESAGNATNASQYARYLMFILGAGALILGGLVAFWITTSITRPLHQAVKIAKLVASGDLTGHIEGLSEDETGQLLRALKAMNDNLLRIVGDVRKSSDTIIVAVKEIAVGNSDLSQRTEEQASSLEETASSMEELISTVKQNADNSQQAHHLASKATNVAIKGGDIVGKVVVTMDLINESSKKIVDIISVIEGIAFQTNILSLNAAVEAARAGEQGRGFAVVAGEVRNLAQRSAGAAKEIKALIGDSVGKVSDGTKLVEEAGRTMDEIVGSVKKVNDIIAEIAAASEEQTSGIEQVNQAIVQMDEVTQQNAALVEEAAASAAALEEQAEMLNAVVRTFKLKEHQSSNPPAQIERNGAEKTVDDKSINGKSPVKSSLPRPRLQRGPVPKRDVKEPNGGWRTF